MASKERDAQELSSYENSTLFQKSYHQLKRCVLQLAYQSYLQDIDVCKATGASRQDYSHDETIQVAQTPATVSTFD